MSDKNVFLIGNESIERAIAEFEKTNEKNFLPVVFEEIRKRMNEDGHFIIPIEVQGENDFSWLTVTLDNGKSALVAFTNLEELKKGPEKQMMSNYILSLFENALTMDFSEGIILNPWGEQLFISNAVIRDMFEINKEQGDGRRVIVENDEKQSECIFEYPEDRTVNNLADLDAFYEYALQNAGKMKTVVLPAIKVKDMEISESAFNIAQTIFLWIDTHRHCEANIIICCKDEEEIARHDIAVRTVNAYRAGKDFYIEEMRRNRTVAKKDDWKALPMPDCHVELTISHRLLDFEREVLRYGNIPKAMEDKWFWYVEDDMLYAHRSWTGCCIYMIDLTEPKDDPFALRVMINHDMDQYNWTKLDDEVDTLNNLLNWWTQPDYDYYGEWLNETAISIQKHEEKHDDVQPDVDAATLIIKRSNYCTYAAERDGKIVVLKGSTINPDITGVMPPNAMEARTKGQKNGTITAGFKLLEDVEFGSLSASAAFAVGHTVSGPKTWKEKK